MNSTNSLTISGSGTANFHDKPIIATTLTMSGQELISGDVTVAELFWKYGTMSGAGTTTVRPIVENGEIVKAAVLEIGSTVGDRSVTLNGRTLNSEGSATWVGLDHVHINVSNGAEFNNFGTFETLGANYVVYFRGEGTFNNFGTLIKTGGGASRQFDVPFNNFGTVDVQQGTLWFNGGYTQTAGETRLSGGSISGSTLDIQGGLLSGDGHIYASVVNRGDIVPGLPTEPIGAIQVHGNYVQPATADAGEPYAVDEGGSVELMGAVDKAAGGSRPKSVGYLPVPTLISSMLWARSRWLES